MTTAALAATRKEPVDWFDGLRWALLFCAPPDGPDAALVSDGKTTDDDGR